MRALRRVLCGFMLVGAFFLLDSDAAASPSGCEEIVGIPSECECWSEGHSEFMYCDFWPEENFNGAQICAQAGAYCGDNFTCYWDRFTVYGFCIAPY